MIWVGPNKFCSRLVFIVIRPDRGSKSRRARSTLSISLSRPERYRLKMAAGKVAHATLKGPSVVKEIVIGITLGLAAGTLWKMHHWNEQRKVRAFYDLLQKGEISVVVDE
ncbi:hypothetical protein MLD38_026351 [Melastoma candidum]|uniref:Uncharacterized protein n=1 Tax=Melastoma candidum TaxID=119954 RepID=A0ACB9NZ81_9MYRT|nr:hypothetical protein MLD38_026351 [Melastoma candidum]